MSSDIKRFAIPLNKAARFMAALKATRMKFTPKSSDPTVILLALLEADDAVDLLSRDQRAVFSFMFFGNEKIMEIKEFFSRVYADEVALCALLNKEITKNYFRKNKKRGEEVVDVSVRNILEMDFNLLMED